MDRSKYLPLRDFLLADIKNIDAIPYALVKYTTANNKTDSHYISRDELKSMVKDFLEINISSKEYRDDYDETSFADATTNAVNFVYTSSNPSIPLSMATLYYDTDNNKWTKIYMAYSNTKNDTMVEKKLLWFNNQYFIINTIVQAHGGETTYQEKVVWNNMQ